MTVNICGIPHEIIEVEDAFKVGGTQFGEITYSDCKIRINEKMTDEMKKEAICHEMVHGIFLHIGRQDLGDSEELVQALGNAICQGFDIKTM